MFAAIGGLPAGLTLEWIAVGGFILVATLGFKLNLCFVVAALAGHGVFDFLHGRLITNPGVPEWWPAFWLACDVVAAVFLAWLLRSRSLATR